MKKPSWFSCMACIVLTEGHHSLWNLQIIFCALQLQGNIALEKSKHKKPFAWLPDQGWEDLVTLSEVAPDTFGNVLEDIERNEKVWEKVMTN